VLVDEEAPFRHRSKANNRAINKQHMAKAAMKAGYERH
jgi:hypothetical protein